MELGLEGMRGESSISSSSSKGAFPGLRGGLGAALSTAVRASTAPECSTTLTEEEEEGEDILTWIGEVESWKDESSDFSLKSEVAKSLL